MMILMEQNKFMLSHQVKFDYKIILTSLHSPFNSFIHTYSLTLIHSSFYSLFIYPYIHYSNHSLINLFIHSNWFTHINSFIHIHWIIFNHSSFYSFIFIHSFIHWFFHYRIENASTIFHFLHDVGQYNFYRNFAINIDNLAKLECCLFNF